MTIEYLELLKKEVESVFGRSILSSSDCQSLSNHIYQQTDSRISFNTLRRLFNLMKSKYLPSGFTLDLLSRYCSFSSYSDFININSEIEKLSNNQNLDKKFLNLLIFVYKDVDLKSVNEIAYMRLMQETINSLDQWPHVVDMFHREIAKTTNGQRFYYEQFINTDGLNKSYGRGLRYYLQEKKTGEAQIFGHSLLCLNAWLTLDNSGVKRHSSAVVNIYNDNGESLAPYIHGKTFCSRLLAAKIDKKELKPILNQAHKFYCKNIRSIFYNQNFPSFEFALAETLILINEYDEATFYIDEIVHKSKNDLEFPNKDTALLESVNLLKAIALTNNGEPKKGKELLETIDVSKFHFLSKQFYSILYMLLMQQFETSEMLKYKIRELINQTGFNRLIVKTQLLKNVL